MKRLKAFVLSLALLCACIFVPPAWAESFSRSASAQCQGTDVPVRKQLRFGRGRTTAVVRDRIKLCTSHDYYLRARRGQRMSVHLVAGKKTSFTVYAPTDRLSDGEWDWTGELPEDGEYQISIGTDVTARYTLEVTIR
jgi:nucleoid-associated protein YgaU